MNIRYSYAWGFKTREAAEAALEDLISNGEVSLGEDPQVGSYRSKRDGSRLFRISLSDGMGAS